MLLGYMRVSNKTQDAKNGEARQRKALLEYGIEEENLYYDVITGRSAARPALDKLLDYCRKGDTVVVSELSRLGRSTKNCLDLIAKLEEKEVTFIALKEGINTSNELGKFFLTICSAFSELELSYINERCQEGIAIAKAEGRMGRPSTDKEALEKALELFEDSNTPVSKITELTGVSRSVIYRTASKHGITRK